MARVDGLNRFTVIGRLTRDPEPSVSKTGIRYSKMTLAINRTYIEKDGSRVEQTDFIVLTFFGNQAMIAQQWLVKGSQVYVEGRLGMRHFKRKDGARVNTLELVVGQFQILGDPNKIIRMRQAAEREKKAAFKARVDAASRGEMSPAVAAAEPGTEGAFVDPDDPAL